MPGFRSGNPLHILIAILVYGVFSIFALAVGLASFSAFSNFVVGATVLLGPVGCYLFSFDLLISAPGVRWCSGFAIRSNILFTASASCSAGCCSAFFVMFLGVGVFDSKK